MIPYMKWNGMDPDAQNSDTGGVFLEIGYSTSFGLCSFITPYTTETCHQILTT